MPQLDRLLSVLSSNRADSLRITQDEPAWLLKGGAERAVTRQPLTGEQLLALLREIAPPDSARMLDKGGDARFEYGFADEVFVASATHKSGRLSALVSPRKPYASNGTVHAGHERGAPRAGGLTPLGVPQLSAADDGKSRDLLDALLRIQKEREASDLHLRSGERPLLRVDGDIVTLDTSDPLEHVTLQRMLYAAMPDRNRREFEELNDTDLAYELEGVGRFRMNVFRDRRGIGSVIRAVSSRVVTAEELGLSAEVQALCHLNKGLVLVTGPTGSGKSTTLCGLIDLVNRTRHDHIVTIEDPIEFVHQSKGCLVTQRQVGMHTSSFKHALRASFREDPDVVLVGELRDLETVSIAIETAETGHLVFGTLHTSTAAGTIDRVIDQFPSDRQDQIRVMLAESLKGVISQSLCRRIGGGRVAAMEILLATPAMSNLIREAKTFQIPSVMQTSRRLGMVTMHDALLDLVDAGKVESREAYLKAPDKSTMAQSLKSRGHDVSFLDGEPRERETPRPQTGINTKTPTPRPGLKS
jgi:twitching motility protein PilT